MGFVLHSTNKQTISIAVRWDDWRKVNVTSLILKIHSLQVIWILIEFDVNSSLDIDDGHEFPVNVWYSMNPWGGIKYWNEVIEDDFPLQHLWLR